MTALLSPATAATKRMEAVEVRAYADLYRAATPGLAERHGIACREWGEVLMMRVGALPGDRTFNRAMGLGAPGNDLEREIEEVRRFFGGAPHFVSPAPDAPEGAATHLAGAGYTPDYAWDKFARSPAPAPQVRCELDIHEPARAEADELGEVVAHSFGLPQFVGRWLAGAVGRPGWTFFTARDGARQVAAAGLYVHGETAWFGLGATLPTHRGRGAQGALFGARIRAAQESGCTLLTTETGAPTEDGPGPSYRNMLRMGFRPEYRRPNFRCTGTRRGGP